MQITDLLKPQSVLLNADPVTKADAIYTLGELMEKVATSSIKVST